MEGKGNKYGVKCPRCQNRQVWKVGFIPTVGGRKDRFKCTVCAHTFYKGQPGTIVAKHKPKTKVKSVVKDKAVAKPKAKVEPKINGVLGIVVKDKKVKAKSKPVELFAEPAPDEA